MGASGKGAGEGRRGREGEGTERWDGPGHLVGLDLGKEEVLGASHATRWGMGWGVQR